MVGADAAGFVYVANSGSQDISVFELGAAGTLRARAPVAIQRPGGTGRSIVLASSPDRAFLYAGYVNPESQALVATFSIDRHTGVPRLLASTPLADSVAYLATDRAGHFLLGASYAGSKVMVNAIAANGIVGETLQVIPTESKGALHPDRSAQSTCPAYELGRRSDLSTGIRRRYGFVVAQRSGGDRGTCGRRPTLHEFFTGRAIRLRDQRTRRLDRRVLV
jgi:6-phosphogluconolactonase (cycloisomerase 2 family)